MARYKPEVGDRVSFQRTGGRKKHNAVTRHEGTVKWIASSGWFLTVEDHDVEIIDAFGEPMIMDICIDVSDILGKVNK